MAEVRGFKGIHYNPEKIDDFSKVITPPFDVIDPQERKLLFNRSPHNFARIILPEEAGEKSKYDVAAESLHQWIDAGILTQDEEDSIYLLQQRFVGMDDEYHIRRGFFAVAKIPDDDRTILGHEKTFHYKVEDRLALTTACQANTGAVFVLYEDTDQQLEILLAQMEETDPFITAETIDGVEQKVWRVPHDDMVTRFFADRPLYIADGHHRYRTAWTYRDQMREQTGHTGPAPWDYILLGFVPLEDPGLFVYPAHRVLDKPGDFERETFVKALDPYFEIEPVIDDLPARVRAEPSCAIGVAIQGEGQFLLRLRDIDRRELLGDDHAEAWRDLDVSVLHGGILEKALNLPPDTEFVYEKDVTRAMAMVDRGEKGMAFILRNMHPAQICRCADAGEYMPQKATYFYPKLPSGAVINPLK